MSALKKDFDPLVVRLRDACALLGCGMSHLYELIREGAVESFRDGCSRKITVASIRRYVEERLKAAAEESVRSMSAEAAFVPRGLPAGDRE
jgi:excisionase family DNA binding protein